MTINKEKDLYPEIKNWLDNLLKEYFPKKKVYSFITSNIYLSKFIQDKNWIEYCSDYATYQIKIDILGVLIEKTELEFIFIEVKNSKISLKDVSQLIGYSKVAQPLFSIILSPKWVSDPVKILFEIYRRYDILKYNSDKFIKIGKWDPEKKDIDYNKIYPNKPLLNF
ncbi:MAG: hypothetical protein ACTSRH_09325 [Promethearchaeota archaeon]